MFWELLLTCCKAVPSRTPAEVLGAYDFPRTEMLFMIRMNRLSTWLWNWWLDGLVNPLWSFMDLLNLCQSFDKKTLILRRQKRQPVETAKSVQSSNRHEAPAIIIYAADTIPQEKWHCWGSGRGNAFWADQIARWAAWGDSVGGL